MNHTVLIVEDEKEIADTLTYALSSESFEPIWVANGEAALATLSQSSVDLCLLDVGLPDANGFELLKTIRQMDGPMRDVPVIFLTARSEEIDRIVGLEIGADDYVCKPFSPREVVARVKVILKRLERQTDSNETAPSAFEHRPEQRIILHAGETLDLTRAEYQLMATFLSQPSRVFSRRQLIEQIWSSNHPSDDRAIDTHIKTLRAKLKSLNPHQEFIVTHRGFGYSLEV
ncbi:two-component system response regulator CreB [Arenicella xantha]|uniref:Two-component system catabolic regulation response regulator CreB n=1 Tax=Arenicella xantha TaxID=644221 RepID=A0A395JJJ1_9GAMM|nr:two-component system response regulator CreB [Arenicella xantha]RBP48938.1 two-component system catabolic regulation response regulator CreB [Arenicella xantha]